MNKAIKGCIIRPNGDVREAHLTRIADKYVLPTDLIFSEKPTLNSVLIEFPVLVVRLNPIEIVPGDAYHKNTPATCLNVGNMGLVSVDWQRKVGAVLVVRMDRKPSYSMHLEALWKFHWTVLSAVGSFAGWEATGQKRSPKAAFEAFWHEYQKKQIEAGREDWEELVSPYDV